jgi:iron complex outermembrane receptor protein
VSFLQTFGDAATTEVTAFQSDGTNMIRTEGAFPNLRLSNSGVFKHRGVETAATIRPEHRLSVDLTYSYLDPDQQTMANPRHKVYVGGAYELEPATISLGVQYVSGLYGADFSRQPIGDYVVVNMRTTVRFAPFLLVYVAAENLLNRQYQIMYDYPMPGTIILAGISYSMR